MVTSPGISCAKAPSAHALRVGGETVAGLGLFFRSLGSFSACQPAPPADQPVLVVREAVRYLSNGFVRSIDRISLPRGGLSCFAPEAAGWAACGPSLAPARSERFAGRCPCARAWECSTGVGASCGAGTAAACGAGTGTGAGSGGGGVTGGLCSSAAGWVDFETDGHHSVAAPSRPATMTATPSPITTSDRRRDGAAVSTTGGAIGVGIAMAGRDTGELIVAPVATANPTCDSTGVTLRPAKGINAVVSSAADEKRLLTSWAIDLPTTWDRPSGNPGRIAESGVGSWVST